MHEIALVNAVAQQFVADIDGGSVSSVVLAIGPKVERDVASTAWEAMVAGTSAESATLDFIDVEQIEVLRGPATLFYGSGAIGGVVNVVDERVPTRRDTQRRPITGEFRWCTSPPRSSPRSMRFEAVR